ncbi:DUF2721 domain-containing protein [Aurantiacibacter poecillastricola]|uniref:DUF2721 domain-containing protein n=1 Tax=Aurantiacibacter poecillastricola TaxID=3064385 RepID=UPI00273D49A1|nr:DUF2721 domain-containing protein [Aurantiacibacter sp. 219JJ12-13]MDP5260112.1 DUF2721 domain-containing protein [Aurantiacibacter sp. 219JJ12-13]
MEVPLVDVMIAQTIQLALAPVFVLVAIGNIIATLTARLGRVVDRARQLQKMHGETEGMQHDLVVREIRMSDNRINLIGRALRLLVMAALCIGLTVVLLFLEEFAHVGLNPVAAGSFILAISLLMWALLVFLRETREATAALRIPEEFLEKDREL